MSESPSFPFVHLRVRSAFSLSEGAIRFKELIELCKQHQMPAVAVTDSANLFGSLEFSSAAAEAGIQPVLGAVLYFHSEYEPEGKQLQAHAPEELVFIVQNETGYLNLLHLASKPYMADDLSDKPMLRYDDLKGYTDGLIVLSAGCAGAIGRLLAQGRRSDAEEAAKTLAALFPERFYIEIMRHGLSSEKRIENGLVDIAYALNLPLVATNDVYFGKKDMYVAHDALLCIADGRYVSEQDRRRLTAEHYFKSPAEMAELFADLPEALENTGVIAKRCSYMSPKRAPILPGFVEEGNEATTEADLLQAQARKGLQERLDSLVFKEGMSEEEKEVMAQPYRERLEFELNVIINMQFPGYFLIVSDFIRWSKNHNIPVGPGRGSGAGSAVAWALYITDLDPLRFGLLFERFLNPERVSMPDFDVDFCQDRRDEVIQYVSKKYGQDRVAQIITFGKLQARAVLRDVGRVLQMPYGQVDKICKLVPNNPANPVTLAQAIQMEPLLKSAIEDEEAVARLVDIGLKLEGLNRHASTHAAGVVIADRPLQELVPLYREPKSTMPVVQYSMKYAELAGLVKFDFLGLKTLTVLQKAVDLLAMRGIVIDLLKLPEGDPKTYAMLGQGDATGVFQMESAGMRDSLRRMKPDTIEDLIALGALYRPGPMDNIPIYIARKHGLEKPEYPHPLIESVLKETFGVIIYQEQVMQIAQLLAGYSLGEADLLRRAMGKKIHAEMEAQRGIFIEKSVGKGIDKALAASVFDLIAKFASYGFNKSHAAAYAVVTYQTAYLKANYPVEFYAASMTYDMHNTDKLATFKQEATKAGIKILPPDINRSEVLFSVESQPDGALAIRYALSAIRNVGAQAMHLICEDRRKNGPYEDVFDMMARVGSGTINRRQMEYLVKAGVFDSLHPNRHQVFAALDVIMAYGDTMLREKESNQISLFGSTEEVMAISKPSLRPVTDWPALEKLQFEQEAIGFYLSAHPLEGYVNTLKRMGVINSSKFAARLGGSYTAVKVAGIVMGKKMRVSDKGKFAFVSLSDTGGIYEVAIFNEALLSSSRDLLENGKTLLITADAKVEESGSRIIAQGITPLDESVQANQRGELRITIDDRLAASALRSLIGEPAPAEVRAGLKICLYARMPQNMEAEIALPGIYTVPPGNITTLKTMHGIIEVEEL